MSDSSHHVPGLEDTEQAVEDAKRHPAVIPAIVIGVVILAVIAWLLIRDDGDDEATTTTTTTSVVTTTTPATTTTASTTTAPAGGLTDQEAAQAMWPDPASTVRFATPATVAKDFALSAIGFTDPVIGEFQQGDSRSGEIAVKPRDNGPTTLVLVRQLGEDGSWFVIGAGTDDIKVDQPANQAAVTSPMRTTGTSLAFEATVQVKVLADGSMDSIGKGIVMGGGTEMAPFSGDITFTSPGAGHGLVVYYTDSAENGEVWSATVVRVAFQPGD